MIAVFSRVNVRLARLEILAPLEAGHFPCLIPSPRCGITRRPHGVGEDAHPGLSREVAQPFGAVCVKASTRGPCIPCPRCRQGPFRTARPGDLRLTAWRSHRARPVLSRALVPGHDINRQLGGPVLPPIASQGHLPLRPQSKRR